MPVGETGAVDGGPTEKPEDGACALVPAREDDRRDPEFMSHHRKATTTSDALQRPNSDLVPSLWTEITLRAHTTRPCADYSLGARGCGRVMSSHLAFVEVGSLPEENLRLRDESNQLTGAIADAYDAILGLCDLAQIHVGSLQSRASTSRVMQEVCRLLRCDAAVFVGPEGTIVAGDIGDASAALGLALSTFDGTRRTGWHDHVMWALEPVHLAADSVVPLVLLRNGGRPFTSGDAKLSEAVAATLAGTVALVQLHRQAVEHAVVERDHAVASQFAQSVLSAPVGVPAGLEVFARCLPARQAGGDFYAVTMHEGEMRFAVGDVAGKGLPAALLMARVLSACRTAFERSDLVDITAMMEAIDQTVYPQMSEVGLFSTLLIGAHRPGSGIVRICNAGHSPAMVIAGQMVIPIPPGMPPLGVLEGCRPEEHMLAVGPGDLLLIGSDGITDQTNDGGELLGGDRLQATVLTNRGLGAAAVGELIMANVAAHAGTVPSSDDQTLLIVGFLENFTPQMNDQLQIAADYESVRAIGPWLDQVLILLVREADRAAMKIRLELAVHEVCINIVDHAYDGQGGWILLSANRIGSQFHVQVTDFGQAYDAEHAPRATPGVVQVRGFGLGIVEQLVDSLTYERIDRLNRWTLSIDPSRTSQGKS